MAKKKGLAVAGGVDKSGCGTAKQMPAAKPKVEKKDKSMKKAKVDKKDGGPKPPHAKSAYQFFCAAERGAIIHAVKLRVLLNQEVVHRTTAHAAL